MIIGFCAINASSSRMGIFLKMHVKPEFLSISKTLSRVESFENFSKTTMSRAHFHTHKHFVISDSFVSVKKKIFLKTLIEWTQSYSKKDKKNGFSKISGFLWTRMQNCQEEEGSTSKVTRGQRCGMHFIEGHTVMSQTGPSKTSNLS